MRAGAPLTIRLLGELELRVDGRSLALPASKKSRALLGYLVATGRPHLRERLCDLLFQGPDDPRAALRWSLTKIRGLLDSGGVTRVAADRDRVAFEAVGVECDLAGVREAFASGVEGAETTTLGAAAERFRGELLEGLDLPDCYRFHEWCTSEREAARALRVRILAALVERHAGKPEEALAFARQRLAVDPLSEPAHVAVVSLLADLGRRREALEQAEACKRIFDVELGTKPSPALLAARMRAVGSGAPPQETTPVARPAAPTRTSDRAPSPLVGRDAERGRCIEALASAAEQGADRVVLVSGEPGIGKTRLLDAVVDEAVRRRWRVLRGRAYEAEMVRPYGAWIDALRTAAPGELAPFRADLAPLLPELGEAAASQDRERLFDAVVRLLVSLPGGAVVVLDDLQWSDEASAALLHYAARAVAGKPVLIACGARAEELADNPSAVRLIRALQRESRVLEVELGPLPEAAVAELARSAHAQADVVRIARESAGNPLFVLELARAAARGAGATSDSLAGLIADRIARVDDSARELLPWAAAIGRTFAVETLERATELPVTELLTALEELERRGILRETSTPWGPAYDFVHDLVRAAAYRRLSEPRRRLLHHRIARALEARAVTDGALHGDVAHHAAIAGDSGTAARAYLAAGLRCLRLFANDEAARLAEAGVAHASQLGRAEAISLTLALLKIKVRSGRWLQRAREIDADLSRAIEDAERAGMHAEAADGFDMWSVLQRDRGDDESAATSTLRAVETVRNASPLTVARQLVFTARCLAVLEREMGRAEAMLAEAEAALAGHGAEDAPLAWARALVLSFRGDESGAMRAIRRAIELARAVEDRWLECECLLRLVQEQIDARLPSEALSTCRELVPVASKMGEGSEAVAADALEALSRTLACVPGAKEHLDRAVAKLREVDAKGMLAYVLNGEAELHLEARRVDEAQAAAEDALRAAEIVDRRTQVARARAVLARVAVARGDRAEAERHLEACRSDRAGPDVISARARRALELAQASLAKGQVEWAT